MTPRSRIASAARRCRPPDPDGRYAIAAAIEEQNAATGEITRNVQQAARGTEEVSANIRAV